MVPSSHLCQLTSELSRGSVFSAHLNCSGRAVKVVRLSNRGSFATLQNSAPGASSVSEVWHCSRAPGPWLARRAGSWQSPVCPQSPPACPLPFPEDDNPARGSLLLQASVFSRVSHLQSRLPHIIISPKREAIAAAGALPSASFPSCSAAHAPPLRSGSPTPPKGTNPGSCLLSPLASAPHQAAVVTTAPAWRACSQRRRRTKKQAQGLTDGQLPTARSPRRPLPSALAHLDQSLAAAPETSQDETPGWRHREGKVCT
jgi:hypothetical protein